MKLVKEAYYSWDAEGLPCLRLHYLLIDSINLQSVVFITSNMLGNSEIMEGCMEAKIPAFGTLWDF
jgi:hypothetical protein